MTVAELRERMSQAEFVAWSMFFQAEEHFAEVERMKTRGR
jgi:hypothetical protein